MFSVKATMALVGTPIITSFAILRVITSVFPEPAQAIIWRFPSQCSIAFCWFRVYFKIIPLDDFVNDKDNFSYCKDNILKQ